MNKVIPNGTEVLIFKFFKSYRNEQDEINYIVGVVQSSKQSEDLSYHGSPYYEQIYEVLGQDGKKYIGTYQSGLIGSYVFRTRKDYIERLRNLINRNNEEIIKIQNKNMEYESQIESLINSYHALDNKKNKIKILK